MERASPSSVDLQFSYSLSLRAQVHSVRTASSQRRYWFFVTNENDSAITQSLRLRTVPVTGTLRLVMTGRRAKVQPYVGAGVAVVPWSYSETGDFVDSDLDIFRWDYKDSGTAVGAVVFGGLRVAVNRKVALGGEFRYLIVDAPLDPAVGFQGTRLDLGGMTYQGSVIFRF